MQMELHPGVYRSNVDSDEWRADPDVGGEVQVFVDRQDSNVGMSRYLVDPGPVSWTPSVRETLLVLEGSVRIDIEGGPSIDLRVGDVASLPEGTRTTWHVTPPFRELWFAPRLLEPASS
jgi:uncharacterized cupin superfamily protein